MAKNKKTKVSAGCTGGLWFGRLCLLLWKNLQYRKRCCGCCLTCCEILLPVIFVSVTVGNNFLLTKYTAKYRNNMGSFGGSSGSTNEPESIQKSPTGFDRSGDNEYGTYILAFYPPKAEDIVVKLAKQLKSVTSKDFKTKSYDSEAELETFAVETFLDNDRKKTKPGSEELEFVAGVIFTGEFDPGKTKISYTIRLPVEGHGSIHTDEMYSKPKSESRSWREYGNENDNWYKKSGFTLIQILLDNILIQDVIPTPPSTSTTPNVLQIQIQKIPVKSNDENAFFDFYDLLGPLLVCGFMFMVPSVVLVVVSEKKSGIKELMKMMGLPNWIHWLGWVLNSMILNIITVSLITFLTCYNMGEGSRALFAASNFLCIWISLFLYTLSGLAFCLFLSSLFQKPILAIMVGLVVWVITYFATAMIVDPEDHVKFRIEQVLSLALLPNYALSLFLQLTHIYENQGIGAQWNNIAEPLNSEMPLALGHVWLMFSVDTLVYLLLAIYLENVFPSEFGIRKPWYYPFWSPCCNKCRLPSFRRKRRAEFEQVFNTEPENATEFETEPTGLNAGIIVTNLSKQFGRKRRVVNNLSFKMFDGQITALLGHNGAGKTTTMSILTGMIEPTSGTATVNGFDIRTQMGKVRRSLGLCPQHNLLFERLNVRENLIFFGRLKGLSSGDAKKETTSLLQMVGMPEKANVLASKLSGGQKRKLCLCMALIGGTRVLILDEPTSGMDPDARRAIWDVLLAMRGSRTILLTTHFMDEADVLGDRIAIMAAGKLQCCGSPEYLKRFYGTGFTLSMTIEPSADKNAIMALVQKHSAEATWKYKKFSTDSELGINLPSKENRGSKSEFAPLLSDLTKKKQDLGVQSIGLTVTTMDDVFVKVGELLEGEDAEKYEASAVQTGGESAPRSKWCGLVLLRFWALFLKRFLYAWRKKGLFISQFLFPLLMLAFAVMIANLSFHEKKLLPKLTMKLSDYRHPTTLYTPDEGLGEDYKTVVGSSAKFVPDVLEGLVTAAEKVDKAVFRTNYIVAADLDSKKPSSSPTSKPDPAITAFYSTSALHAIPLSVNLVSNAILKFHKSERFVEVSNHPFENEIRSLPERPEQSLLLGIEIMYVILVAIGYSLFAGFLVVFPIEENLCKGKQLQLMSGVNPLIFWGSLFLWDVIMVLILAELTVVILSFHNQEVFTSYDAGGVIFLIVLVFGLTLIPFAYVCSLFLKGPSGGFAFIATLNMILAIIFNVLDIFLEFAGLVYDWAGPVAMILRIILMPFPCVAFINTIYKYGEIAYANAECNFIPGKLRDAVCQLAEMGSKPLYQELYHCCHSCNVSLFGGYSGGGYSGGGYSRGGYGPGGFRRTEIGCHTPVPFLTWTKQQAPHLSFYMRGTKQTAGILQQLFFMSLVGLFYTLLLLMEEFGILGRLKSKAAADQHNRPHTDEDVIVESQRVQQMIASGQVGQDAFVAGDISKSYGGFAAVSNLSFGVHHGECFGLLGVNGAGKTTAFRILTGDETSSGGDAYILKLTLKKNKKKFLGNIGYCPQFDGIVGDLTGREMLELFARLRGIQGKYVNSQATLWLKKMGLYESRNQLCKNYSGGMKRRLSAGMALIGEPRIIMLDEPTSGVDPMSRRRFWDVLAEARNSGQSIILTSHSMEECEALCTRLGIMVNGQLQCFGEVEYLKTKFAQGFSLVLKLKPLVPPESPELAVLHQEILKKFEPCELKDQHQNVLHYQITNKTIGWDNLFKQMEDIKTRNEELIEEYSVNDTTLEDVFLAFARQQYPQRIVNVSCFKQCILCQCC